MDAHGVGQGIGNGSGDERTGAGDEQVTDRGARVVCGIDDSAATHAAVVFAAREAVLRGAELELLHAFNLPVVASDPLGVAYVAVDRTEIEADAKAMVEREVLRARDAAPAILVHPVVVEGSAGGALVDASKGASVIVVGARHHRGLVGLITGSVARHVLDHAHCPVAVVPAPDPDREPVPPDDGTGVARDARDARDTAAPREPVASA